MNCNVHTRCSGYLIGDSIEKVFLTPQNDCDPQVENICFVFFAQQFPWVEVFAFSYFMLPSYLGRLVRELMSFKIHFFCFSFKALRSYHLPSYSINTRSHLPGSSSSGCSSNPHVSSCYFSVASSVQSTIQQIWHWPQHPVSGYIHFPLFSLLKDSCFLPQELCQFVRGF